MNKSATTLCYVFGVVFLAVGVLGFVSNPIVGAEGIFLTNTIHNVIHLATGVLALLLAKSAPTAFLKIFGAVYLVVAVLGLITIGAGPATNLLGLVAVNHADNWLHVVLGVVIVGAGFATGKKA